MQIEGNVIWGVFPGSTFDRPRMGTKTWHAVNVWGYLFAIRPDRALTDLELSKMRQFCHERLAGKRWQITHDYIAFSTAEDRGAFLAKFG